MAWIDDQMDSILAVAEAEIAACGGDPLCFVGLVPGGLPVDIICDDETCGQLTLRLVGAFRTDPFPSAADPAMACNKPMAYELELRAMRCFDAVGQQGESPTPVESRDAVRLQNADMEALFRAIRCDADGRMTAITGYAPEGPQGNYVGGSWTFIIARED